MSTERVCPGLPADWLNAWLAAIGCTVLLPELRLTWSDDLIPLAVFTTDEDDHLESRLAGALPTSQQLASSPMARRLEGFNELRLNPSSEDFRNRASFARRHPWHWMLSSLYTDARIERKKGPIVDKGPFMTPMPGTDNTMHDRISKLLPHLTTEGIVATFDGVGTRVQQNGIGFDISRIGSLADESQMFVDPTIELLALFGLALFPTRGHGTFTRQRGWGTRRTGAGEFSWFAWGQPLDVDAIDAWLDAAYAPGKTAPFTRGTWEVIPYGQRGSSDTTRGFGSRAR